MNRILFISTGLNRGGAETQVLHLSRGLLARGWQVEVVSLIDRGNMVEEFQDADVPVHQLGMKRGVVDPRAILRLRKIIRRFRPDVVHSHMVHANLLARVTRMVSKMPVLITTVHSGIEGGLGKEMAYRITDRLSDLTTIISHDSAERYVRVGAVPAKRLKVVVNGLPVELFRPMRHSRNSIRQELGIGDEFVWLAVGRLDLPKDYPNLLNAISRIPSKRDLFLIAGDGPMRSEIETMAASLHIDRIRLLGIRKDVSGLMSAADGYVMSSAWEGLPMVLLEAAASGLPIVATDVGGNREVVRDGISGYLVPKSDPDALAAALQRLQTDSPSSRDAMGAAGRDFVVKNFSLSAVLDQWELIYKSFMVSALRFCPPVGTHLKPATRLQK
jgi:glycosyltransferase involved in cell wall biosynthesis